MPIKDPFLSLILSSFSTLFCFSFYSMSSAPFISESVNSRTPFTKHKFAGTYNADEVDHVSGGTREQRHKRLEINVTL